MKLPFLLQLFRVQNPILFLKGKRFDGPTKNYPGISVNAEDAMVNNFYKGSSSMIVRLGAVTGSAGTDSANRMYGLLFKSLAYDVPVNKKIRSKLWLHQTMNSQDK